MKRIIWITVVLILASATYWFLGRSGAGAERSYRFVTVERGKLESLVSSTGTLGAVTTVQVGTQVSGIIAKILVDFNDRVTSGQTIALIDTTLLASAVRDARANLERAQAELAQAGREFQRLQSLYDETLVAETEFNLAQYALDVARANGKSAQISLERAMQNLAYATIRAPISGTVIERNVDVGQTVAASFSAPQLFLIANDLARMQILASVDESDIGQIKEGQQARFTVQAYPDESFTGTVHQVRLQSTILENVVNYTVVVDVENPAGKLLPGMTATVDFIIEVAEDVMTVPNAALRFRPPAEMIAEVRERRQRERESLPDSVQASLASQASTRAPTPDNQPMERGPLPAGARGTFASRESAGGFGEGLGGGSGGSFSNGPRPANMATLWYLDHEGNLAVARVRTGITDGQSTEIRGRDLTEGMQVIAGISQGSQSSSTNPFQGQQPGGPPRPGGF